MRSVWVRAGVTLLLLAIVASRLDWSQIGTRLREGQPVDFLFAVGLVALALVVGAWRWHALLYRAGVPLGVSRLARIYAVSTFSSSFLPTTAGGDVTRALLVTRGPDLRRVAVSIVVDRAGGLAGLIGLAWLALALEPAHVPGQTDTILIWTTLVLAIAALILVTAVLRGGSALRRRLPDRLLAFARDARDVLRAYGSSPSLVAQWLALSVLFQGLIALQLVMLGRAIDVELSFATAAIALTFVTLVTLVPISIGGFGIREGSYVVLLGGVSIAASDATLISVLSVATLLVASLPGAYMIVRGNVGAVPQ
ncbi:MAG TPA: lysylphosphatidylglycerol synthase transmembrane domain-containing protein [Solirubrobacterales bacterium]|nr:lysylphosphatidylglycerol synthase transmembrane domain-containing protein [Solirubrobacterales bacterium]